MATYFQANRHDIGFTDPVTGDVLGFLLARDQSGLPIYAELDSKYLATQFFTGSPSIVNMNPEEEIPMILDDFRKGFGQEIYDSADPKRYYSAIGMDLSVKGQAMAGWGSTAVTKPTAPSAPSIVNADMELTTGWTTESGTTARSAVQAHGGTYSWKVSASSVGYQNLSGYAQFQGLEVTFTCWVWANGATIARIAIDDGVGTTSSSYHTGGSTWEQLSVVRTLNKAATKLALELQTEALNDNNYFDDAAVTITALTIGITPCFADFNDALYASFGTHLGKLNAGGTAFDHIHTFPANITALVPFQVSGTDYLLIALGTSNAYWYMTTAEAFTESTATNKTYKFVTLVFTTASTLYANDGDNTARSTTNPLNGGVAWSAQTVIGNAADTFTGLLEKSGAAYFMKEDMPYYLNSSGVVQQDLAPELKSAKSSTSGKNAHLWKGELFIPAGDQALLRIGTANEFINPASYSTNLADFVGQVMALASDEEWLFAAVDNSTKIEILKGRDETVDSTTSWVWHPFHELTLTGGEKMYVSTVYQKRLWISSTLAGDSLYYLPLPTKYGDITNDANRSFKTSTECIFPALHGGFKSDTKAYIKAVATLSHAYDADIYFECWYKKLQDSAYTDAGDFKGTSTNRVATLYLPADSSSNNPISTMMWFKLVAKTDDTNKTPILLNFDVRGILYPTRKDIIACTVRVGKELIDNEGQPMADQYTVLKNCMDNIRDATWVVAMKDIDGTSINVRMLALPSNVKYREIVKKEKGRTIESHYNLLLLKVATS